MVTTPNTSATGGYLKPAAIPAALDDEALEDFFHDLLAGVSGLPDDFVRPDWQGEPPNQPERSSDWLSFRISTFDADAYAFDRHQPAGDPTPVNPEGLGNTELQRHETLEVAMMAFGPNAGAVLGRVRDGLQVEQNRAVLTAAGMGLRETGRIVQGPVLNKSRWLRRLDMPMYVRRQVNRTYPIRNIVSGQATINAEAIVEHVNVSA